MDRPRFPLSVVMQKRPAASRWQAEVWEAIAVLPGETQGGVRCLLSRDGVEQWLHPGYAVVLRRDEAEGHYLNVSLEAPRVFVAWRMEGERALPIEVTTNYLQASAWMDAGLSVDSVAMPPELHVELARWVAEHYRPEPKKRIRPRSFLHPKDRSLG